MGYVARFSKGTKILDLSSGRYSLGMDFVPPRSNIGTYTAGGTSANRYGGSSKVGERASNGGLAFSVRVQGSSNAEVERGVRDIASFLQQAGDEADPVYFEWRPDNNVGFEPLWGQFGANLRVEVVSGMVDRWGNYFVSSTRESAVYAMVAMEIKPFALGKRQPLASAKGHILEDTMGVADGSSRGVIVGEATTNKFTDPIYGSGTAYWAVSNAALLAYENTDDNFILFGDYSAKLVSTVSGHFWKQSINAGTTSQHVISGYVKRPSGSAVTSSDCQMVYNTARTTTFQNIGNGWYRAYATVAAVGSAVSAGIQVLGIGKTLYVDGFQLEESSYTAPTAICHGDLLGCAWSGAAHASTSTATTGHFRVLTGDIWNNQGGTVRCVVKWAYDNDHPNSMTFFDCGSVGAYFDVADNKIKVLDGTNTVMSAAITFSVGDIDVFHFVITSGRIQIYRNGVSIASDTDSDAYTPEAPGEYFYIGSSETPGSYHGGTFLDFTTFDLPMTTAEVLADYNNVYQVVVDGHGVSPIPYLWTKDGDDRFDFSDSGSYSNWGVIGGIPGNVPSETEIEVSDASSASLLSNGDIYLSKISMNYGDYASATALTYNGPGTISVGASEVGIGTLSIPRQFHEILGGQGIAFMVRGRGTATDNLTMRTRLTVNGQNINSDLEPVHFEVSASDTSIDTTPYISSPAVTPLYQRGTLAAGTMTAYVRAVRTSGTENFFITSAQIVPRPMARIEAPTTAYGAYYMGGKAVTRVFGGGITMYYLPVYGDVIEFDPYKYNTLIFNTGAEETPTDPADVARLTCKITPRWSIA